MFCCSDGCGCANCASRVMGWCEGYLGDEVVGGTGGVLEVGLGLGLGLRGDCGVRFDVEPLRVAATEGVGCLDFRGEWWLMGVEFFVVLGVWVVCVGVVGFVFFMGGGF